MAALAPLAAEDLKVADFDYIRLQASIGVVAAPDVTEDTKDSAGTNTSYEWNGTRDNGIRGAISAIFGRGTANGGDGWQWGVELAYARYDITPSDYTVAGAVIQNGSGNELEYRTIGVNVLGGWQWGMTDIEEFTGFVEIMPHLGGGLAFADNEVNTSPVGSPAFYEQESGTGYYWEAGLTVGAYITERRLIYGVNVSYTFSAGKVDMDFPGGYSSDLDFRGHGFGIGAVAGYRF